MTPKTMTKDERSMLVYAESCAVDASGLLEGVRMNAADMKALDKFKRAKLLDYGRTPSAAAYVLRCGFTHWVTLTPAGWTLAHECRKLRAEQIGPNRQDVNAALAERARCVP